MAPLLLVVALAAEPPRDASEPSVVLWNFRGLMMPLYCLHAGKLDGAAARCLKLLPPRAPIAAIEKTDLTWEGVLTKRWNTAPVDLGETWEVGLWPWLDPGDPMPTEHFALWPADHARVRWAAAAPRATLQDDVDGIKRLVATGKLCDGQALKCDLASIHIVDLTLEGVTSVSVATIPRINTKLGSTVGAVVAARERGRWAKLETIVAIGPPNIDVYGIDLNEDGAFELVLRTDCVNEESIEVLRVDGTVLAPGLGYCHG
jgi:hypothetical protein